MKPTRASLVVLILTTWSDFHRLDFLYQAAQQREEFGLLSVPFIDVGVKVARLSAETATGAGLQRFQFFFTVRVRDAVEALEVGKAQTQHLNEA